MLLSFQRPPSLTERVSFWRRPIRPDAQGRLRADQASIARCAPAVRAMRAGRSGCSAPSRSLAGAQAAEAPRVPTFRTWPVGALAGTSCSPRGQRRSPRRHRALVDQAPRLRARDPELARRSGRAGAPCRPRCRSSPPRSRSGASRCDDTRARSALAAACASCSASAAMRRARARARAWRRARASSPFAGLPRAPSRPSSSAVVLARSPRRGSPSSCRTSPAARR